MAVTRGQWLIPAVIVGIVIIAVLAFGVFGVQTLFYDDEVSEAAPVFTAAEESEDATGDADTVDDSASDAGSDDDNDTQADDTGDEVGNTGDESGDTASGAIEPVTAATGQFVDGAHPTVGAAVVLTDGGSQRVLRLGEDFATDNGPDLNVYLAPSADGFGDDYIDLGDLKGNIGSQNYEIPADVDLSLYDTVVIWCVRFGVGFGSADLTVA